MTNIAHVSPTYYSRNSVVGGGEKYVLNVARSQMKAATRYDLGIEISLVAFGEELGDYDMGGGLTCKLLSGRAWDANSLDATTVRGAIAGADFVFVHQCLCAFGMFIASQAKILGKFVVGLDHGGGEHPMVGHTPEIGQLFDLFLAYSEFGAQGFADLQGTVRTIRGPVDNDFFHPLRSEVQDVSVLAVGRILPHKGFDRIIKALPDALDLTIVGSKQDVEYHDYLVNISAGKKVNIIEDASDLQLRELLRSAGLFVHASTHVDYRGVYYAKPELLGLAPLEALACGVPTLVSSAGSLPELTRVVGCESFGDDRQLEALLRRHAAKLIDWPNPETIAGDVDAQFGLLQYGDQLLRLLGLMR